MDNLFVVANSGCNALRQMEIIEEELKLSWDLTLKKDSKCIFFPRGCSEAEEWSNEHWPRVTVFPVLGHRVAADAGPSAQWEHARSALWRSFWRGPGSKQAQRISQAGKARLLHSKCRPHLDFHWTSWIVSSAA